jgi:hypothetical protein
MLQNSRRRPVRNNPAAFESSHAPARRKRYAPIRICLDAHYSKIKQYLEMPALLWDNGTNKLVCGYFPMTPYTSLF